MFSGVWVGKVERILRSGERLVVRELSRCVGGGRWAGGGGVGL